MKKNPILHLLSLFVLLGIVISPLIPSSTLSAAPVPAAPQSQPNLPKASPPLSKEAMFAFADNCDTATAPSFIFCLTDGTNGSPKMQVQRAGSSTWIDEGANTQASPNPLLVAQGDTLRVPFSVTYAAQCGTNTNVTVPNLRILMNPLFGQQVPTFTTTYLNQSGQPNLTFQDGQVNFDTTSAAVDTAFGYFEFVVGPWFANGNAVTPGSFLNFQMRSNTINGCNQNVKLDVVGPSQYSQIHDWRRPRQLGFSLVYNPATNSVPEFGTADLKTFTISNITADATFSYAFTLSPTGTGITPSLKKTGTIQNCDTAATAGQTIQCDIGGVGPLPESVNALTVSLAVTANITGLPAQTQYVTYTIPILHPSLSITKADDQGPGHVYPPGSPINYTVTLLNTGALPLTQFSVLDTLGGDLTKVFVKSGTTTPCFPDGTAVLNGGETCVAKYSYTLGAKDTNPLLNTATADAIYKTGIGTNKPLTVTTTYSVIVEAPDLTIQFGSNGPTPDYVQTGKTITGDISLKNTGTVDLTINQAVFKLVNAFNPTQVLVAGNLTGVPSTIAKGATVTPNPTYSINIPTIDPSIFAVDLIIYVEGKSLQTNIVVPRTITKRLDVVRSALRIKVTSDATSDVVVRGQNINYTVEVQNLGTAPLTNIKLTGETLNAYPGGITNVPAFDLAVGATKILNNGSPYLYTVQSTDSGQLVEKITATFNSPTETATGQLTLTISDLQMRVTLFARCSFPAGTALDKLCSQGGTDITNNQVELPSVIRYFTLLTNIGTTRVTNIRACATATVTSAQCKSGDPRFIALTTNVLDPYQGNSSGEISINYGATTQTILTEYVSVFVTDQVGRETKFIGSTSLSVISSDQYLTMTKDTLEGKSTYYLGETIHYHVKACYNGPSAGADITGFVAYDKLNSAPNGLITLTVKDGNGTVVDGPAVQVKLRKNDCAEGDFAYQPPASLITNGVDFDLTNTVEFSGTGLPLVAKRSYVIKLKNPLKLTKILSTDGTTDAGQGTVVETGRAIYYIYKLENLGPLPIDTVTTIDRFGSPPDEKVLYRFSCTPNSDGVLDDKDPNFPATLTAAGVAGSSLTIVCQTFAYGGLGKTTTVKGTWQNTIKATGKVGGLDLKAEASVVQKSESHLEVTKTIATVHDLPSDPPEGFKQNYVYIYDPPATYTVTIKNNSDGAFGVSYRLITATDLLNGSLIRMGDPTASPTYSITGDTLGYYSTAPGTPVKIKDAVLAPGTTFIVKYQIDAQTALAKRNSGLITKNTFTLTARVASVQGGTNLPDTSEYYVQVEDSAELGVAVPFYVDPFCTKNNEFYVAWGERPVIHYQLNNFNDATSPSNIQITKLELTLGEKKYTLPLPPLLKPGDALAADFTLDEVPWNATYLLLAGNLYAEYTQTPVAPATGNAFNWYGTTSFCEGVKVGPPVVLTKTANPTSGNIGSQITYTITAENKSYHTTVNVTTLSDLKTGRSNVPLKIAGNPVTQLKPGDVAAADPFQYTIQVTDAIPFVNTAILKGTRSVDGAAAVTFPDLEAKATVTLPSPDLKIELETYDTSGVKMTAFDVGKTVVYAAKVKNQSDRPLQLQAARTTDTTLPGFSPADGLTAWITQRGNDVLQPGEQVYIPQPAAQGQPPPGTYRLSAPNGFSLVPPQYTFTSTLQIDYIPYQVDGATTKTSTGNATIDLNNPNLQVTIRNQTNGVARYGTVIVYDVRVTNTSSNVISNLKVSESPIFGIPTDLWYLNGQGTGVADITGLALDPGQFYSRTVRHEVITSDFSPLVYTVTAEGTYKAGDPPNQTDVPVKDVRSSSVIISDKQLTATVSTQKAEMTANDSNQIEITYTNIGSLSVFDMSVVVSAEDANGTALNLTFKYDATCVLSPQATDIVTDAKCEQLPPVSSPSSVLGRFDSTKTTFTFKTPNDAAQFASLPNPLVLKFTASGSTQDGLAFEPVITRVPIRLIRNTSVRISEVPNVSAATVGGTVNYAVQVQNLSGSSPLAVTEVRDGLTGALVTLNFAGGAATSGTIPPQGVVTGTTPVVVQASFSNPFLHTTTVKGTQDSANVTDTSFSQVNLLNTAITVNYTAPLTTVPTNSTVNASIVIQNISTKAVTLTATDTDKSTAITLYKDAARTQPLGTDQVAPNGFAYAENVLTMPTTVGAFSSHIRVDATDIDGNKFAASRTLIFNVVGVNLIFSLRPAATPAYGKAGDTITINFKVKNAGVSATENLDNLTAACSGTGCNLTAGFPTSLAFGVEATGSFTYVIQPQDTGIVTLPIIVQGHQVGTDVNSPKVTANDFAQFTVAVGNLVVTKTSNAVNGASTPGSTLTYSVTLRNVGTTPITIDGITDTLVGTITPGAAIAGGASRTVTYDYTIPTTASGTLLNTVIVNFTNNGTKFTATAQNSVAIGPVNPTLIVRVIATPNQGTAGTQIVYSTEVTNNGTQDLSLLGKNDAAPANGTNSSLGIDMNVVGVLAKGQTKVFTSAPYTIPVTASGTITNNVTVVANNLIAPITTLRASGSATITVIAPSGLSVTKTADRQTAKVGDKINYTVLVRNTSANDMNLTAITDSLVSSIPNLPTLPAGLVAGASLSFTYSYTVKATDPAGLLPNTVTVTATLLSGSPFYVSGTANVIITTGTAGLFITGVTNASSYTPGDTVYYNVTVINTGAVAQNSINGSYLPVGSTVSPTTFTLNSTVLQPNEQTTGVIAYATSGTSPDPLQLALNVSGTPGPTTSGTTNIIPRNSGKTLTALMTASPAIVVAAGDTITYTLKVWNTGTSNVTDVAGAFSSDTAKHNLGSPYTSGTALSQLSGTTLAPGESRSVTFTYTVLDTDLSKTALLAAVDLTPSPQTTDVLTVSANAVLVGLPVSVNLTSFNCTPVPDPSEANAPYCFVRPNTSITGTVTVENKSSTGITNLAISFNSNPTFTIPLTTAEQTLAAGASLKKNFTWTIPTSGITTAVNGIQKLPLSVTATGTGMSQTTAAQHPNMKFIDPKLTVSSVGLNSGYSTPITDLSDVQFKVSVSNSSGTALDLALVGKDSSGNQRFKVALVGTDGTSKDITSSVTISSPTAPRTGVIADLVYGSTTATDVILNYKIQATDPNPFRIVVSAVGCVKLVAECESGTKADNQLNTPVTTTGTSTELTIARARIVITESSSNPKTGQVGQALNLVFTINNPSTVNLVNLAAADVTVNGTAIAEKLSLNSATGITANSSLTATLTHTVLSTDPKSLQFLIRLTGNSGTTSGPAVSGSYTTQTITIGDSNVAANGLAIAMAVDKTTPTNGAAIVYTVTLTNTSAVQIQTIALTDTLPTTLKGTSVKTDTGSATLSGSSVAASIGTLAPGAKAVVTINATVNATAPATITNQACATSATNTTPICASQSVSLAAGSATNPVTDLPVTGIGGVGDLGGLFLLLVVSALLFLAMTARTRGAGPLILVVAGVIVAIIALALIFTIIRNTGVRVAANATNTAIVAPTVIAQRTNVKPPPLGSATPLPNVSSGPTWTPIPSLTPIPTIPTATPEPPLFQPVGEKSLYVPKLGLPGAIPIIELPLKNETWDVSTLGQSVGHLEQTSWLGRTGNTVLVAHIQLNFREMGPFLKLNQLQVGDKVMVYDQGKFYVYEVTGSKVVSPTDVAVTYPTTDAQLTLITCTVWDANRGVFSKRLVVTAKLVKLPASA